MRKVKIWVLAILLLVLGAVGAYEVLKSMQMAHVSMTVLAPEESVVKIEFDLGTLKAGEKFDVEYCGEGKEIMIRNTAVPLNVIINVTDLSDEELNALYDCELLVKVYNETMVLCNETIDVKNQPDRQIMFGMPEGEWDVYMRLYGQAGMPKEDTSVDFNVTVNFCNSIT